MAGDENTRRARDAVEAAIKAAEYSDRRQHVETALTAIANAYAAGEDRRGIAQVMHRLSFAAAALAKVAGDVAFDREQPAHVRRTFFVEWRQACAATFLGLAPPWMRRGTLADRFGFVESMLPWSCKVACAGVSPVS